MTKDPRQLINKLELDGIGFDRILVAFSGGKDSLACVLHLKRQKIWRNPFSWPRASWLESKQKNDSRTCLWD